jgi:hypothetical protein
LRSPCKREQERFGRDLRDCSGAARPIDSAGIKGVAGVSAQHAEEMPRARIIAGQRPGEFVGFEKDQVHRTGRADPVRPWPHTRREECELRAICPALISSLAPLSWADFNAA